MKYWRTYVDLTLHLIFTLLLAWFFYKLKGGWLWPALAILGGVFIDLDHLIDYFLYFGWTFDLKAFFKHEYLASGRMYIIFHSVELAILVWALALVLPWAIPVASGMTLHLIIDISFSHSTNPLFASFIFRWCNHFVVDKIYPDLDFK